MFKFNKSFKLLSYILSVTFLTLSMISPIFALDTFSIKSIETSSQPYHTIRRSTPDTENEQDVINFQNGSESESESESENGPQSEERASTLGQIVETANKLESKIENTKRILQSYDLSPNDKIYLELILKSTYESAKNYITNISSMVADSDTKFLMYKQHFEKNTK